MQFQTQTAQALHDEHMTVKSLLEKLESELVNFKIDQPPAEDNRDFQILLADLAAVIESELFAHFDFEEDELFPLLNDAGASDMTTLLTEEHEIILPVAREVCEIAKNLRRDGYATESWNKFRVLALELVERLTGHIEKEEIGLVPMLDGLIDEALDTQLAGNYIMAR